MERIKVQLAPQLTLDADQVERFGAFMRAWKLQALEVGARLRRAAMTFNRAVCCQHAHSIGAAYEAIDDAKGDLDELLSETLEDGRGPSPELFAQATRDYHAQRDGAVSIAPPPTSTNSWSRPRKQASRKTSEATTCERQRLRLAQPDAFDDGARSGFLGDLAGERESGGYPIGFHAWTPERRSIWFSGFNAGRLDRVSVADGAAG